MTDKQKPAQFDWATELSDAQGHVTLSKQEAKEIGARLCSMSAKLKAYEDLGDAADDVQLLRMGYAAARLEIESLHAKLEAIGAGGVSGPLMGRTDSKERAGRFTKKPVTIDAWLIDFGNKPLPDWVNEAFRTEAIDWCPSGEGLYINTLEGHMLGANGSWLIKGVQGELYACKPDIFAATYERASLAASAGSEPVAHLWQHCETGRTRIVMPDMIVDADASWQVVGPLYLGAAPPTAQAEGWRPIETAPKDKSNIVLLRQPCGSIANGFWLAEAYAGNGAWIWPYVYKTPTHWMPLPPPPTSAEGVEHG